MSARAVAVTAVVMCLVVYNLDALASPAPLTRPGLAATDALATERGVPIPSPRPERTTQAASTTTTVPSTLICQDPRLAGNQIREVLGKYPGCAVFQPVKVHEIAGVRMSTPVTLDCRTARSFANWIAGIAQPAARDHMGARIAKVWIMGSYSCRTRNNRPGARLSEHSAGRAVDIGGVWLGDGRRVTVSADWSKGDKGDFLSEIRAKACGMFTTVLGPGSDRFHRNHLHLDMAYRDRTHCR